MNTLDLLEASQLLKLHPQTVLQRARSGEIPAAKPGKCWVFVEEDLINWLRSHYNSRRDARQGGHALCSLKEKTQNSGGLNSPIKTAALYAPIGTEDQQKAQEQAIKPRLLHGIAQCLEANQNGHEKRRQCAG